MLTFRLSDRALITPELSLTRIFFEMLLTIKGAFGGLIILGLIILGLAWLLCRSAFTRLWNAHGSLAVDLLLIICRFGFIDGVKMFSFLTAGDSDVLSFLGATKPNSERIDARTFQMLSPTFPCLRSGSKSMPDSD